MLVLVAIYALLFFGLAVLIWAGTAFIQGYLYETPLTADIFWRAPAAGLAVTLFIALWGWMDARAPGTVAGMFQFRFRDENGDKPFPEFWAEKGGKETHYKMRRIPQGARTVREYVSDDGKRWPQQPRPDALLVQEKPGEPKARFEAKPGGEPGVTQYVDSRGRVLKDDDPGVYSLFRWGLVFKILFLYGGLLVVWFLSLWLLARFQWSHALGLAVVLWLVTLILLVPLLLEQVENRTKPPAPTTAWRAPGSPGHKMCMMSPS